MTHSPTKIATIIAIIFHAVGLIGMAFIDRELFIRATPIHLLLMCALLFYTQQKINGWFLLFFISAAVIGFAVEVAGTSTGLLFGNYAYGAAMGYSVRQVPLMIGVNWFIIIYCCGCCVHMLLASLSSRLGSEMVKPAPLIRALSVILDGALLAVITDAFLEPAAIKLSYWHWLGNGDVPWFNYTCWFVVSAALLTIFQVLPFGKHNKFALHLLLIQVMFFLLVHVFL